MYNMATIAIANYRYRHEAEFAKAVLHAAGVESVVMADDAGGMDPWINPVGRVRLFVNQGDVEKAILALRDAVGAQDTPD